jgi:hypothetical protein
MCVGQPEEAAAIARAMVEVARNLKLDRSICNFLTLFCIAFLCCCKTGLLLDFITVDGAEGGTGAAPAEVTFGRCCCCCYSNVRCVVIVFESCWSAIVRR